MKLWELAKPKGTYAGVRFDTDTVETIQAFLSAAELPNAIRPDKMHTTLLYSRKFLPKYTPQGEISPPYTGTPTGLDVWESTPEDPDDTPSRCLVLEYTCPELVKRHEELMKEHEATYDYDEYKVHVTLSYDIGDMDIDDMPKFSDYIDAINIVEEYGEELDLGWAKNKGVK